MDLSEVTRNGLHIGDSFLTERAKLSPNSSFMVETGEGMFEFSRATGYFRTAQRTAPDQ